MRKRKLRSRMLAGVLGILGFVGCDGLGDTPDMYGCPTVDFQVKGTVTSEDGEPLEGIRVVVRTSWDNNPYGGDTVYTDAKGEFRSRELSDADIGDRKAYFNDIDGEAHGGVFKPDSVALKDMKQEQLEKGDGWYSGKFELSPQGPVKLKKEEKKTEE